MKLANCTSSPPEQSAVKVKVDSADSGGCGVDGGGGGGGGVGGQGGLLRCKLRIRTSPRTDDVAPHRPSPGPVLCPDSGPHCQPRAVAGDWTCLPGRLIDAAIWPAV